jgi:hypothetical protein
MDTLKGIYFSKELLTGYLLVSLVILGADAWFFNEGHLSAKHEVNIASMRSYGITTRGGY